MSLLEATGAKEYDHSTLSMQNRVRRGGGKMLSPGPPPRYHPILHLICHQHLITGSTSISRFPGPVSLLAE